jgi:short-subunit dehydrogenase
MKSNTNTQNSILITGASSGLGEGLALHYARPGVFLALTGRNPERLEKAAQHCRERGAMVETLNAPVTDKEVMERWIEDIDTRNPIDLVIANAGISGGTGGSMIGEGVEQARNIFDVNVTGIFNTIEPILPRMLARQSGQIALISSLAGFRGSPGAPAYSASKGAVKLYGEALRGSLADAGVKVNVVCPGFVRTRMTQANDFPMPFLMDREQAVQIIARGLSANKGRIAFPLPTHFVAWFGSVLPDIIAEWIYKRLPAKGSNKSEL